MKLTLFTISNEQIKEQLSKLQTKVESLETVKEVQDKIISAKDSQISFLNDSIANIWASVSIAATFIIFVFGYVAWLNKQAQNKVEQAESLIRQNQQTANIAQEKLNDLEEKQLLLQKQTNAIENLQKFEMITAQIQRDLGFIQRRFDKDRSYCVSEQKKEFNELSHESSNLEIKYLLLSTEIKDKIAKKINILEDDIRNVEQLQSELDKFTERFLEFSVKLRSQNSDE
ncbi:hypothetical protein [Bacillus toyonensis]|uniref:hypothetical protein n=1 Tax=Bacillus toyonensis TaxID=155322 RepID=UPI000BFB50EF|nr:hypothetical protein [Bacillus toyonensis]PHC14350.1 hypothetical protein COF03_24885 [Bacillus toyonensis]